MVLKISQLIVVPFITLAISACATSNHDLGATEVSKKRTPAADSADVTQAMTNARNNVRRLPYDIQSYANQDLDVIQNALNKAATCNNNPPAAPAVSKGCQAGRPKCIYYSGYSTIRVDGQEVGSSYGDVTAKQAYCDNLEAQGISCGSEMHSDPNSDR